MKRNRIRIRYLFLAIAFAVLLIFFFINISWVWGIITMIFGILTPFFIGFLIAYILNFPYKFLYTKAFAKMGEKHKLLKNFRKPLALIITYVGTIAIFAALIIVLIPQIISNLSKLVNDMPSYYNTIQGTFENWGEMISEANIPFLQSVSVDDLLKGVTDFFTGSQDLTKSVLNWLQGFLSNAATFIYNSLMGVIISVYFLIYKDQLCVQLKKLAVAFIPIKYLPKVYEVVDITDTKCGRFLVGDILDAGLIGVLFFIVLSIFNFPYASLIAVLCGLANVIPFFGPFIGGIPSAFILFMINPWLALWFILIAFVIQQVDGNILKPKIIGNHVGLSSFWVLFSVIVGGALFGVPGFILGTPIYAVIYFLIAKKARIRIEEKGNIAKEALEFRVLNYAEIAEEQKRIRAEKELEQKKKLHKLLHFGIDSDDEDDEEENGDTKNDNNDNKGKSEEKFADQVNKNK